ncbi:MAG TPA: PH domain-containing protein [Fimbriimonadaceae bacterium]|nr:PH domain-containing protein [Fimbriimonadaceae bacterium]
MDPSWEYLAPAVKKLWRIEAVIAGLVYAAMCIGADFMVAAAIEDWPVQKGLIGGALGIAIVLWLQYVASRKFEFWRYLVGEDDLAVAHGIWWRSRTYVPRARIQHVDVTAGPIARFLGLAVVSVFVSGHTGAVAVVPGLAADDAEALRRRLLRVDRPVPPPVKEPPIV